VSGNGTAVYLAGRDEGGLTVQSLDPAGNLRPLLSKPGTYAVPRFSPDGTRLALVVNNDLWIYDLKRDTMTRLTFGPARVNGVVWRPDGNHLFYREDENLFWIRSNGTGKPQRLADSRGPAEFPNAFTADGKWFVWGNAFFPVEGGAEQWRLGKPEFIARAETRILHSKFSPDAGWLAYSSAESGRSEIYVRSFPRAGEKWQISNAGGMMPDWSRTGRELFYKSVVGSRIMAVSYETRGDSFLAGKPRLWSETVFLSMGTQPTSDLAPDGKSFAVLMEEGRSPDEKPRNTLTILLNFFTELRRYTAAGEAP
jgi:dipeptidyl aminopeptidase/acylaminoacyl peptidase